MDTTFDFGRFAVFAIFSRMKLIPYASSSSGQLQHQSSIGDSFALWLWC
jgi:hypothetical protein